MELKILQVSGTDTYIISAHELSRNTHYRINGEFIDNAIKNKPITFSKNDTIEYQTKNNVVKEYRRNKEVMSVENFKSKPTYYDCDSSEEQVLRAIANKKELEGFKPHYKKETWESIELKVVGYVENTGSKFITSTVNMDEYASKRNEVTYRVEGSNIAMDEYLKLSVKYCDHAKFSKPDRKYLRYVRINDRYAFNDNKPFGDWSYVSCFLNLEDAQKEEETIRNQVRGVVVSQVFTEDITGYKMTQVLAQLRTIRKLKTKKSANEIIDQLIEEFHYLSSKSK